MVNWFGAASQTGLSHAVNASTVFIRLTALGAY